MPFLIPCLPASAPFSAIAYAFVSFPPSLTQIVTVHRSTRHVFDHVIAVAEADGTKVVHYKAPAYKSRGFCTHLVTSALIRLHSRGALIVIRRIDAAEIDNFIEANFGARGKPQVLGAIS